MRFRLVVALLVALAVFGTVGSACADSQIGVSRDRVTWSSALHAPLFDPNLLWVPGDVESSTFYVKNQASDAGSLWLRVDARDADGLLARDDLKISVRRDGGPWIGLGADGNSHPVQRSRLRSGAVTQIDVRAVFLPSSPNRSQRSSLALRFTVGLSEAGTVSGPQGGDGPGGLLPNAGGVPFWVLALGVVLFLGGFAAAVVGARRTDEEEERR